MLTAVLYCQVLKSTKEVIVILFFFIGVYAHRSVAMLAVGWLKMPDMKLHDMKMQDMNLQYITNIVFKKYITLQCSVRFFKF